MENSTCSVDGCGRPRRTLGYCNTHYQRLRTHGDVRADIPVRPFNPGSICKVADCDEKADAQGFCPPHYRRWKKHDDPLAGRLGVGRSIEERLTYFSCLAESGCIEWTGALRADGYGQLYVEGKMELAHRLSYQSVHGALDSSLEIDHICRNRKCINPEHLRQVDRSTNAHNRGGVPNRQSTTGVLGVHRKGNKFTGQIRHRGKTHWVGTFSTIEEAEAAVTEIRAALLAAQKVRAGQ